MVAEIYCPNCGTKNYKDDKKCLKCGTKLHLSRSEKPENLVLIPCEHCSEPNSIENKFCTVCGNPISPQSKITGVTPLPKQPLEETKKQSYYIDDDGKTTYTDVHSADWEKRKGILNARIKEAQPEILDPLFYESSYINNDGRRIGAPIDSITWKKRKSDLLYRLENDDTESLSRDLEMLDDMVQQEKHISTSYLNEQNHRIHSEIDSIAWKTRKNFLIEKIQAKPLEDTLSETKRLDDMIQQENAAFDQEKLDEMLAQEKEYDEAQNQNVSTIMRCPNCGHELTIGDDFCTNCGTSITGNVASTGTNQPKRSMALPIILISAIVLIAIIVGVIVMAHSAGENSRKILSSEEQSISRSIANNSAIVPSVAGQTLSQAVSTLKNDGFTHLSTQEEYNTDQSSGNVIKTNPAANSRVNKDMTITIYVSKGTQMITVPDVTGQSEANAKAKLTNLGFKVTTTTQSSNDVASGTVLSMSPAAGASQAKGSTIALTISSGATLVTIPNWSTSMTATNLQSQLQALGVQVNMVSQSTTDSSLDGLILNVSQNPGTQIDPTKTTVTITYFVSSSQQDGSIEGGHTGAQTSSRK